LILYFLCVLNEIPADLVCDKIEIDRYFWLSLRQLELVLERSDVDDVFEARCLDGSLQRGQVRSLQGNPDPETGEYKPDRVSTGTQMVLEQLRKEKLIN
jgi:hypothetical protein